MTRLEQARRSPDGGGLAERAQMADQSETWWAVQGLADAFMNYAQGDMSDEEITADAEHIAAAADPAHGLAVLAAADATLDRHPIGTVVGEPPLCGYCGDPDKPWPCPDAAAVLDLYAPEPQS